MTLKPRPDPIKKTINPDFSYAGLQLFDLLQNQNAYNLCTVNLHNFYFILLCQVW